MGLPGKATGAWWMVKFLNSAFGLWLLSTVFVGVGGWWVQQGIEARELRLEAERVSLDEAAERRKRLARLDTEIAARFAQFLTRVELEARDGGPQLKSPEDVQTAEIDDADLRDAVRGLSRAPDAPCPAGSALCLRLEATSPDFAGMGLLGVAAEAARLEAATFEVAPQELTEIGPRRDLLDRALHLEEFAFRGLEQGQPALAHVVGTLYPLFTAAPAWRDFPYMDCSAQMPFC